MKTEILINLVWMAIWAILGTVALVGVIFYGAWWHLFTVSFCALFICVLYDDPAEGNESVKTYLAKVARAKRIR